MRPRFHVTPVVRAVVRAAALLVLIAGMASAAERLAAGQPAPDIHLQTAAGKPIALAELKGKVVLVDFWASWCQPCKQSFPALDQLYRELHDHGLEVIAINLDERRSDAERFLADRPHAMPIAFDADGRSPRAFGLFGMPTSFLIGRDGRIRFVHEGYSGNVLAMYRREIDQLLGDKATN